MTITLAHYKCERCYREFNLPVYMERVFRGVNQGYNPCSGCVHCGSMYVQWINYKEFMK